MCLEIEITLSLGVLRLQLLYCENIHANIFQLPHNWGTLSQVQHVVKFEVHHKL